MINLSVNVNKVATLRNARGGHEPNVVQAARTCIEAGCQGITVHPREDQRHIQPGDVYDLNIDNLHRLRDLQASKRYPSATRSSPTPFMWDFPRQSKIFVGPICRKYDNK